MKKNIRTLTDFSKEEFRKRNKFTDNQNITRKFIYLNHHSEMLQIGVFSFYDLIYNVRSFIQGSWFHSILNRQCLEKRKYNVKIKYEKEMYFIKSSLAIKKAKTFLATATLK